MIEILRAAYDRGITFFDCAEGVAGGVTAITTGKYAGAFAAVNVNNSEVVIFKLD